MKKLQFGGANWLRCVGTLDANRASSLVPNDHLRVANIALPKEEKGGGKAWRN